MAPSEKRFQIPDKSEQEFLKRLARTDPSSPALLGLSRAYLAQSDPESSARLSQEVLSAHPGHLEAALLAAQALLEQNSLEAVKEILDLTSGRLEEMALIFKELASLYETTGDTDQAARMHKAAIALISKAETGGAGDFGMELTEDSNPVQEGAVPTETLAGIYLEQGSVEKALDIYNQILEANPDNISIRERIEELQDLPAPLSEEAARAALKSSSGARMRYINKLTRLHLAAKNVRESDRIRT